MSNIQLLLICTSNSYLEVLKNQQLKPTKNCMCTQTLAFTAYVQTMNTHIQACIWTITCWQIQYIVYAIVVRCGKEVLGAWLSPAFPLSHIQYCVMVLLTTTLWSLQSPIWTSQINNLGCLATEKYTYAHICTQYQHFRGSYLTGGCGCSEWFDHQAYELHLNRSRGPVRCVHTCISIEYCTATQTEQLLAYWCNLLQFLVVTI